ncbi:hypothetical protein MPTK1_6g09650 [Marchantia polymorpha subsp. ruderalis]|uniref:Uncharacterized protein n=2 Tax=Marchantia polymorpha TaxID=3197 RepID=A0AAF6BQA7_MARPO|nr:hypothetical protein MARPO_0016s0009 [Marchantia polymorpha]BBN14191.1 hypothetical protein Mp_6g09650 [Marchantia polymorpha subsp. ruderalis]|eukprot:PTQ44925.1 hypothetical protein MARPO_0016s0009 [Marchantia polymorpha]
MGICHTRLKLQESTRMELLPSRRLCFIERHYVGYFSPQNITHLPQSHPHSLHRSSTTSTHPHISNVFRLPATSRKPLLSPEFYYFRPASRATHTS